MAKLTAETIERSAKLTESTDHQSAIAKSSQNCDRILSDRLEMRGITEPITENGIHYGVEVRGKVFDNLSVEGMELEAWLSDFHCPSEEFVVQEMDNFSGDFEVQ